MKVILQFVVLFVLACGLSCKPQPPEVQFVRQIIPIEIQSGKPVTFEIQSLSGNGANDVGIRCLPGLWNVLTNSTKTMTVRLKSSDKVNTEIGGVDLNGGGAFLGTSSNVHYLFYIGGERRAKASVEISFPNTPTEPAKAEIIVGTTPADTDL